MYPALDIIQDQRRGRGRIHIHCTHTYTKLRRVKI